MIRIKKGLDLPIQGEPQQVIENGPPVRHVALVAPDYIGMKPTMLVNEGDNVKLGQPLFTDKKTPGFNFPAPGSGKVVAINRGAKRAFQSVVVELDGKDDAVSFDNHKNADLTRLSRDAIVKNLTDSGLWASFRTRPYSKVPLPGRTPHSIFVTAMDTNPLAADPIPLIHDQEQNFLYGIQILRGLTDGIVHICKRPGTQVPGGDLQDVKLQEFEGPHPAGLPGTHIHYLDPVHAGKTVWYINSQDVIAIGKLFVTGKLDVTRVIALGGPAVNKPRLIRTRLGADLGELLQGQIHDTFAGIPGAFRVISGSVLSGRKAEGPYNYLGRYALQVSVIKEGVEREFLGWQRPGRDQFSIKRVFASALVARGEKFQFTTSTHGSKRAMVPIGMYENVMPMDILPTQLLRSLIVEDYELAQQLGALELDEEDLALCTFVCPGKYEYGPLLRKCLAEIEHGG